MISSRMVVRGDAVEVGGKVYAASGEWSDFDGFVKAMNEDVDFDYDDIVATREDFRGLANYDGTYMIFYDPSGIEGLEDRDDFDFAGFMRTWSPCSVTRAVRQLLEESGEDVSDLEDDEIDERADEFDDDAIDEKIRGEYDGYDLANAVELFEQFEHTNEVAVFSVAGMEFTIPAIDYNDFDDIFILGVEEDEDVLRESFESEEAFLEYVISNEDFQE